MVNPELKKLTENLAINILEACIRDYDNNTELELSIDDDDYLDVESLERNINVAINLAELAVQLSYVSN